MIKQEFNEIFLNTSKYFLIYNLNNLRISIKSSFSLVKDTQNFFVTVLDSDPDSDLYSYLYSYLC